MSTDREYEDLERAERRANRILKRAHYRVIDAPRCNTCAALIPGGTIEDADQCADAAGGARWIVGVVYPDGVCDNWRPKVERRIEEARS